MTVDGIVCKIVVGISVKIVIGAVVIEKQTVSIVVGTALIGTAIIVLGIVDG